MPFLIVAAVFLLFAFVLPRFTRYLVIAPLLAFAFGGCGWSCAGFMGVDMNFGSFLFFMISAYVITVAILLKTE